jgi:hypothetical protein
MTPFESALWLIAAAGGITAVAALLSVRRLRQAEREIAEQKAAAASSAE